MSADCSGINYALSLREGTVEIRARLFSDRTLTMSVDKIKSIELLRKSVMPPAMIGAICLSIGLLLGIAEDELIAIIPLSIRVPLRFLSLGIALVCLMILLSRWFFASLIVKPVDGSSITVRMVPTGSARHLITLIQSQTPTADPS